jgi:hypothetical protein
MSKNLDNNSLNCTTHHIDKVQTTYTNSPFSIFLFCSTVAASATQFVTNNLILQKHSPLSILHTKPWPTFSHNGLPSLVSSLHTTVNNYTMKYLL